MGIPVDHRRQAVHVVLQAVLEVLHACRPGCDWAVRACGGRLCRHLLRAGGPHRGHHSRRRGGTGHGRQAAAGLQGCGRRRRVGGLRDRGDGAVQAAVVRGGLGHQGQCLSVTGLFPEVLHRGRLLHEVLRLGSVHVCGRVRGHSVPLRISLLPRAEELDLGTLGRQAARKAPADQWRSTLLFQGVLLEGVVHVGLVKDLVADSQAKQPKNDALLAHLGGFLACHDEYE
mmetsp:Transcript_99685/g.277632  ORF Transcript_99685/g.277632 Transcript_99685/m.277632 type:complete len:229 (+) Transcript_99685:1712-2398(+)